ncbi:uncharacterized protein LOC122511114 [Leptopilina heterotoma]|uniref:uncharacterized protein LOC122511114 n=1 Tax=Leptopilina heterotoma TaxID=63436 RepID=UPI001CA85E43|nr:uncharacterized protein LOC122511114 [Leptopilina heterotoma]
MIYNLPTANEVAVVFVDEDGEPPIERDFCIYSKFDKPISIPSISRHVDPMTYPLMYPSGGNAVAWTGIAANLLINGKTVHTVFKLPLTINEQTTCNIRSNTIEGDFRQTLPIVRHGNRTLIVNNCVKRSNLWSNFQCFTLSENIRLCNDDKDFNLWLLEVGNGKSNNFFEEENQAKLLPSEIICNSDIVTEIYGNEINPNELDIHEKVILAPRNNDVFELNNEILERINGESREYLSIDFCEEDEEDNTLSTLVPTEVLNTLTPNGLPPHKLNLKIGAIVILLRNVNLEKGLCNGTRLRIIKLENYTIYAEILTGNYKNEIVILPRITLSPSNEEIPFKMSRKQFPIRLGFALTINKSQGQSFKKVGLYLPSHVFSHGQFYVGHQAFHPFHFGPRPFPFGHPQDPLGFKLSGLQHLSLDQGGGQGWGGLPRGALPPHCLPPPPGHHSHTHPTTGAASAFNPFHHSIEQRSPRMQGSATNDSPRNDLGPISVSVREATPNASPANPGPGLLTTASVTAPTPPAESTTTAPSPSGHHSHFQGLHLLGATNSLFGSIFAPLLPQSSWLYNPLYHTQQYILEPEWHALALRMAQHRLQRPDQVRLEELKKLRANSGSPDSSVAKEEAPHETENHQPESPDGSIEVDDRNDQETKSPTKSERESPVLSPVRSEQDESTASRDLTEKESQIRLRPSLENLNESEIYDQEQTVSCRVDLPIKIRVEGSVDLSTKRGQDKENVGQDLTTRKKDDDSERISNDSLRTRRDRSPKPRQVWRPY